MAHPTATVSEGAITTTTSVLPAPASDTTSIVPVLLPPLPDSPMPYMSPLPESCELTPHKPRRYSGSAMVDTPRTSSSTQSDYSPSPQSRYHSAQRTRKHVYESPYSTRRGHHTHRIRGNSAVASDAQPRHRVSFTKSPRKKATKVAMKRLDMKKYLSTKSQEHPRPTSATFKAPTKSTSIDTQHFIEIPVLIFKEMMRIFSWTLRQLISPIAGWLVFLLFVLLVAFSISATIYGICTVPGASLSPYCLQQASAGPSSLVESPKPRVDYSSVVTIQNKLFDQLLETATGGSALSLEIKRAQMATKDFIAQLKVSKLGCKDTLSTALKDFEKDAETTGHGLRRFAARVDGSADHVLAASQYALETISGAQAGSSSSWRLLLGQPHPALDNVITERYQDVLVILTAHMKRLILEAEKSHVNLVDLEDRLTTIHGVVVLSDSVVSEEMSGVMEQFWTKLGGNRQALRQFSHHLSLLKGLEGYRKQALAHVVAALETLHAMSADIKEIQERFLVPGALGIDVPVEVLLRSILMGIERLQEGRTRARRAEKNGPEHIS